jgi:energy-coupling factor transporter transmembrane protein EcfT
MLWYQGEKMEFREELKHKKIGTIAGIFVTLGIVAGMLALIFITSFLSFWLQVGWIQFTPFVIVIIAVFWIVKYYLTDYIYVVQDGNILFGRKIGAREKELYRGRLKEIKKWGNYESMQENIAGKVQRKFTFYKKKESYVLDFGKTAILFSPTEELKERIRKKGA